MFARDAKQPWLYMRVLFGPRAILQLANKLLLRTARFSGQTLRREEGNLSIKALDTFQTKNMHVN
jgi:hypothetical protein